MFKAIFQGKPIRHPLHPLLIHFPIALLLLSLVFDLSAYIRPSETFVAAALYTMGAGIVMALIAAGPGLIDWLDIRSDHPAKRIGIYHMVLNLTVVALYIVNFLVRYNGPIESRPSILPFLLSLIGIGILGVSGYLGGMMVYDDGIAVGRHRRWTRTPQRTLKVSGREKQDGMMVVAGADQLPDGETLRVDIDGQVIAVARQGDRVYAFQEFCTHRYGPLSEGKIDDGHVTCPWHRSCFDMKTGKVVDGPAKVEIKSWEAVLRDGKVLIRI